MGPDPKWSWPEPCLQALTFLHFPSLLFFSFTLDEYVYSHFLIKDDEAWLRGRKGNEKEEGVQNHSSLLADYKILLDALQLCLHRKAAPNCTMARTL